MAAILKPEKHVGPESAQSLEVIAQTNTTFSFLMENSSLGIEYLFIYNQNPKVKSVQLHCKYVPTCMSLIL